MTRNPRTFRNRPGHSGCLESRWLSVKFWFITLKTLLVWVFKWREQQLKHGNLLVHISDLCTKWMKANTAGAKIEDTDFWVILLSSLPTLWDSLVAALYDAKSWADIIIQLTMHWSWLTCNGTSTNPTTTNVTLQANMWGNQKPCWWAVKCKKTELREIPMIGRIRIRISDD